MRRLWRFPAAVLLLFGGLATVLLAFPLMSPARRDATVAAWSRLLLRAFGVRLRVVGQSGLPSLAERPGGRMVVANHVSWIDIFAIDAIAPSCFIAKDDIARWPLIGTLVGRVGTLFLERGKRHAVHQATVKVAHALKEGRRIAVFPEGTTSDGARLLPFHANLLQSAVQAGVPVDPVALRYTGLDGEFLGDPEGAMHFAGDITFLASAWRLLGAPGVIAELHPLAEIAPEPEPDNRARHRAANEARQRIRAVLDLPLEDTVPDGLRDLRAARP